jgi:hypothetical protein
VVSAIWTFVSTPLGRRIALIGGLVALVAVLWIWHQRQAAATIEAVRTEAINARDEMWRGKLKATEDAARDTIRRREAAAYQRAMEDEAKRRAADAAEAEKAATIVERVIKVSPSARDCTVDQATADALNELRGSDE